MGMAVMLDEIINYVQSLQNQVEVSPTRNSKLFFFFLTNLLLLLFCIKYMSNMSNNFLCEFQFLSMKLTAASTFYDFNSETDAVETMQVLIQIFANKCFSQ